MFSHLGSTFTGVGGESEAGEDLGGSGKGLGKDLGVAGFAEQHHVCDERPALTGWVKSCWERSNTTRAQARP